LLWRHIGHRAKCLARTSQNFLSRTFRSGFARLLKSQLCQTEVQNPHLPLFGYEDVLGFDITMYDSFGMRCRQSVGNLNTQIQQLFRCNGRINSLSESLALQQLHGDEGTTVKLVNIMNYADVGMVECRSCPCFPPESLKCQGMRGQLGR